MYVCICKRITDNQVHEAIRRGARSVEDLGRELGIATGCGQCACFAAEMLGRAPASSGAMTGVRQSVHPDAA